MILEILKLIVERKAIMNKVTYFRIYINCNIGLSSHEPALKLSTSLACSEDPGNEIWNPRRLGVQKNLSNLQPSVLNLHMTSFPIWFQRHPHYAEDKHNFIHTAISAGRHQTRSGYNFCKQVGAQGCLDLDNVSVTTENWVPDKPGFSHIRSVVMKKASYSEIRKKDHLHSEIKFNF